MNAELVKRVKLALSDAIVMYAPEFCNEETIAATRERKQERGTLAYFGDLIGELTKIEATTTANVPVEDCPNMPNGCCNDGCVPYQINEDEWEAQQCEFCYEVPWSRFNINRIIETYSNSEIEFSMPQTGRIDGTKFNLSNTPKSKEEA